MEPVEQPADRERGAVAQRVLLTVALALTVSAIAVGTWVLGSGSDPNDQERVSTVVSELSSGTRAQPPLPVAPLPGAGVSTTAG
jgi:hypothetical protein